KSLPIPIACLRKDFSSFSGASSFTLFNLQGARVVVFTDGGALHCSTLAFACQASFQNFRSSRLSFKPFALAAELV
ncbi:MAG: hypothetical protein E7E26_11015, partial [Clostridiales bacterium]|nr:hypothetical protein [Clostridiales bacterium]